MPYRTLADFLDDLGRAGELAAVDAEVDLCLEVAEITRRTARRKGPALLFRNVRGHDIPLLTNLFGTEARILRALGADSIEEATARIDRALNIGGSEGWLDRLRFGGKGGAAASFAPTKVKSAACQQVVRIGSDINLEELPVLGLGKKLYKPTIHSVVIISAEPETHVQTYLPGDVQITGRDTVVTAYTDVAAASRLANAYQKLGRKMPLAIVVGGDPIVLLASASPLPSGVDPLGLAGLLREKPLDAVACRSVDLIAPAESDFVIEGEIANPSRLCHVGPRLSPSGRPMCGEGHAVRVTAVTHRSNRVFPTTVPGDECNESALCHRVMARVFGPYLKVQLPELFDFDLPLSGGARHIAVLAIEKTYAGQARHVATVAWGLPPFQFARLLIIVDADVDVHDMDRVLAAVADESNCAEDIWEVAGPNDPIDPTSFKGQVCRRIAIDATCDRDVRTSRAMRLLPNEEIAKLVTERWAEYGLGPESET